jgi:hypothetical protein
MLLPRLSGTWLKPAPAKVLEEVGKVASGTVRAEAVSFLGSFLLWASRGVSAHGPDAQEIMDAVFDRRLVRDALQHLIEIRDVTLLTVVNLSLRDSVRGAVISINLAGHPERRAFVMGMAATEPGSDPAPTT